MQEFCNSVATNRLHPSPLVLSESSTEVLSEPSSDLLSDPSTLLLLGPSTEVHC